MLNLYVIKPFITLTLMQFEAHSKSSAHRIHASSESSPIPRPGS
jgi:hypothetical protein